MVWPFECVSPRCRCPAPRCRLRATQVRSVGGGLAYACLVSSPSIGHPDEPIHPNGQQQRQGPGAEGGTLGEGPPSSPPSELHYLGPQKGLGLFLRGTRQLAPAAFVAECVCVRIRLRLSVRFHNVYVAAAHQDHRHHHPHKTNPNRYTGELLPSETARARLNTYDAQGLNYLLLVWEESVRRSCLD